MRVVAHSLAALSALILAPPAVAAWILRRSWREGAAQRLGVVERSAPGSVWVHASSAGEARAAVRLIQVLQRQQRRVFASASTLGGRQLLRDALPGVPGALAPLDHLWCVESALARVRPALLVLIETELWPGWIAAAKRRGIPVAVISARISDRSFPRYRRWQRLFAPTLRRLDAVGARSPLDAERFAALGVPRPRIELTGDLKLEVPDVEPTPAPDLAKALSAVPIFVAGSTHAGEEGTAVAVVERCRSEGLAVAAVVAPRHLDRVTAVERELRSAGVTVKRRSRLDASPLASGEILLLDTLGELPAVYSAAAAALVGGTLVPLGGHNLLEPVFAGCPVIFGPFVENARAQAEIALSSGAGEQVRDASGVAGAAVELLRNPVLRRTRVERGRKALEAHRGSPERSAALLGRLLAAGEGPPQPPPGLARTSREVAAGSSSRGERVADLNNVTRKIATWLPDVWPSAPPRAALRQERECAAFPRQSTKLHRSLCFRRPPVGRPGGTGGLGT